MAYAAARDPNAACSTHQVVHIIEDDELFRSSLLDLFQANGIEAEAFADAAAFLSRVPRDTSGCLLVDIRLPGVGGIDFRKQLKTSGYDLPVVFMTAYGDVATSVVAMKTGAVDFLQKPLLTRELLDAVNAAFAIDLENHPKRLFHQTVRARAANLTRRENQVMRLVVSGLMNKQIAFELGISEIMVKLHRGSMMRKMQVTSLAELVRHSVILLDSTE
ncbi:response regulator transcription factor [Agrobacterium pusense]|uniref:response regulator transcription factor n=1 Tax=Agrobacterium TaxID=357 RepID=UPI000D35A3B7|nr:response regulator [Agrobacterium pusense]PTV69821.1 DNA-binding response regulator [Agrobacterium pusense]